MATMKISELIKVFEEKQAAHGDVPVVLWDLDTSWYFSVTKDNIEAQRMNDGSVRVSIGANDYEDPTEDEPASRPIGDEAANV